MHKSRYFLTCLISLYSWSILGLAEDHQNSKDSQGNSPNTIIDILIEPYIQAKLPTAQPTIGNINYNIDNARELAEIALLHSALKLGGFNGQTRYVELSREDEARADFLIRQGYATVSSAAWFSYEGYTTTEHIQPSAPLITETYVGLYTTRAKAKTLNISSIQDLRFLSAAVDMHWRDDYTLLKSFPLKKLTRVNDWRHAYRMVHAGRIDFCLAPFTNNPGLANHNQELSLYPIPGVKVKLPMQRRWAISKKHPSGRIAYITIEKGLAILKSRGDIDTAYRRAGVINSKTESWKLLNP